MATYLETTGRVGDRKHWYVCGPDRGMVAAAYHELREALIVRSSRAELVAPTTSAEQLRSMMLHVDEWEELPPLYIVENAQDIDMSFLMDARPGDLHANLLAVGAEDVAPESSRRYKHFFRRKAARMVRCAKSSDTRIARWVQLRTGCLADTAAALVWRAGGNTDWLAQEVRKLRASQIGESLRPEHLPKVLGPGSAGHFAHSLVAGDRRTALDSIPSRSRSPLVLAEVERCVIQGALVHETQKNIGWSQRVMMERTGISQKELAILRAHVNSFDRSSTERRLTILARASERAARGERSAWLSIIAAW